MKTNSAVEQDGFGANYSNEELADHYEALIGDPIGKDRAQLIAALRNTEFEEYAFD